MTAPDTTLPDWAPTTGRIASLLWEHTRDSQNTAGESGVLVDEPRMGTFTSTTSPTLAVVTEMIEQACDTMAGLLEGHDPCNASLVRGVRGATAYLAAALSEAARSSQATAGENTAYAALYALWEKSGPSIAVRVVSSCPFVPDNPDDPEPGPPGLLGPVARLPCHEDRVTWQTEF
jgi:hypothetical protein